MMKSMKVGLLNLICMLYTVTTCPGTETDKERSYLRGPPLSGHVAPCVCVCMRVFGREFSTNVVEWLQLI